MFAYGPTYSCDESCVILLLCLASSVKSLQLWQASRFGQEVLFAWGLEYICYVLVGSFGGACSLMLQRSPEIFWIPRMMCKMFGASMALYCPTTAIIHLKAFVHPNQTYRGCTDFKLPNHKN